jgi:hypothetical protein
MKMNDQIIMFGSDEEIADAALVPSAVRDGTHDAISTLTKYAVVGGAIFGLGYLFLPRKITKSLQEKYL